MKELAEKIKLKLSSLSRRDWLIFLLLAALVVFYTVAEDVHDHELLSALDPAFGQWLLNHISPFGAFLAQNVTRFGGQEAIKAGATVFIVYLLFKRQWLSAGMLASALFGGFLLNDLIKNFFMRARPDFWGTGEQIGGYSFPSNHSMAAFTFYGMVAYLLTSMTARRNLRILIWTGMGGLIFAIGLSRLALGVHYLTDVLGGWLAGGTWLLVCILGGEVLKELLRKLTSNASQRMNIKTR